MAIKKSELYSSIWASCDELRGGMDASQYKDYVLTLLFVKYISDKAKHDSNFAITIPQGASFDDMVNLIGTTNIGDDINKKVLNKIKEANGLNDFPDFNDENKLGKGADLVDTISNLIRIFNDPSLDFSKNTAEGDDILGDAYEYLMRHFATESGKSKGQFYTPAEVSRVLAKVIGITPENSTRQTTVYDPTCGSGSLLLKVRAEAGKSVDLYGQEKEMTTANLAHMNTILHNAETATIIADNTLTRPAFKEDDGSLKRFDYVVSNPPFSLKSWSNGVKVDNDEFGRFELGVPPEKNGDYAFLLHILKSLKATGKAAVVLPHGVLFRGNAEGEIRKNILKEGYIKGIIGLPPNLFYGTGIPACIIILDKEKAANRKGVFMIDASKGFAKDGNKNRLMEQDIRRITDVFTQELQVPKYSRMVPMKEIADIKNDYNLNIPRYVDTQEAEDIQSISAHLFGGIPQADIDAMKVYWETFPQLRVDLFDSLREGFLKLKTSPAEIKKTIFEHPEFTAFHRQVHAQFDGWLNIQSQSWEVMEQGVHPKEVIASMGESLLVAFREHKLINNYDLYERLMQYWNETMQDDVYSISLDGWKAGNEYQRLVIKGKRGKDGKTAKDKDIPGLAGIEGRMIPPTLLVDLYFAGEKKLIEETEQSIEHMSSRIKEIEEENSGEDGLFGDLEKVNAVEVNKLLKARKKETKGVLVFEGEEAVISEEESEIVILEEYLMLTEKIKEANKEVQTLNNALERNVMLKYPALSDEEIKKAVIQYKWKAYLQGALTQELDRVSQNLSQRIKELAERYAITLEALNAEVGIASEKVKQHLAKMGWSW